MRGKIFLAKRIAVNNNSTSLIDPFIEVSVPFLPTTLSFSFFGTIIDDSAKNTYRLDILIEDETGHILLDINGNLDNNTAVLEEKGIMPIDLNFDSVIFRNEGLHKCILKINGEELTNYEFHVDNKNIL